MAGDEGFRWDLKIMSMGFQRLNKKLEKMKDILEKTA